MEKIILAALRLSGAVVIAASVNPLLSASAEEANVAKTPEASKNNSSVPKSKTGWYVTAGAGASWESSITDSRTSSTYSSRLGREIFQERHGDVGHGDGFAVEAGVGYDFGNRLRAELTYLYNTSSLGSQQYSGSISYAGGGDTFSGQADVSGRINRNSILASLYYDIATKTRWVPYVGAGLGYTNVSTSDSVYNYNVALGSGGRSIGASTVSGGSGSAFGYQAKIGLSYLASSNTDLFVEGNYFGNTSVDLGSGTTFGSFNSFGAKAGFRYRFGK
jgi:opacity protein-like surface antigen